VARGSFNKCERAHTLFISHQPNCISTINFPSRTK
jgi:hypothetical protein